MNDLTTSQLDRQNILNNSIALKEIEHELSNYIGGTIWKNQIWFTKEYLANFFKVDIRTIERIVDFCTLILYPEILLKLFPSRRMVGVSSTRCRDATDRHKCRSDKQKPSYIQLS